MTSKFNLAGLATILLLAVAFTGTAHSAEGNGTDQKAVLVTGASTGIGRMIAEALAAEGYFVYAAHASSAISTR